MVPLRQDNAKVILSYKRWNGDEETHQEGEQTTTTIFERLRVVVPIKKQFRQYNGVAVIQEQQ